MIATDPWESTMPSLLQHASTLDLLVELDRRLQEEPGQWTWNQASRLQSLSSEVNFLFEVPKF
jgi:hypothetical protein